MEMPRLGGLQRMDRLQQLIFSFYREDPQIEALLEPSQLGQYPY